MIFGFLTQRRKGTKKMTENEIAKIIVDTAFHIHKSLGPGAIRIGLRGCFGTWVGEGRVEG